jgi:hypothetical protein
MDDAMKQLVLLISLVWSPDIWAQQEHAGDGEDFGNSLAEPAEHFDILQLSKGASVVLPHPASTLVPLNVKVQVTATDRKQILKIAAVSTNGSTQLVKIAVYDRYQSRVKYVNVRPGSFVLYAFNNLSTLQIVPQNIKHPGLSQTRLLLESNRPLGVSY